VNVLDLQAPEPARTALKAVLWRDGTEVTDQLRSAWGARSLLTVLVSDMPALLVLSVVVLDVPDAPLSPIELVLVLLLRLLFGSTAGEVAVPDEVVLDDVPELVVPEFVVVDDVEPSAGATSAGEASTCVLESGVVAGLFMVSTLFWAEAYPMVPTRAVAAASEVRVLKAFMLFLLVRCQVGNRGGTAAGGFNRLNEL
jgi:hypothetical protein